MGAPELTKRLRQRSTDKALGRFRGQQLPVSYREGRRRFRTGDILCFRGQGLGSYLIRWATRSVYSHCGLTYVFEDRVYCLEAVGAAGVRLALMSTLIDRYDGGVDYFDVIGPDDGQRKRALGFAFQQLGRVYDNRGILRFARAILMRNRDPKPFEDQDWFCSELVAAAYSEAGFPLVPLHASYTSPQDLAGSNKLRFRHILRD